MNRLLTNSLAAFAAVILATASIGSIVTVPPAHSLASDTPVFASELA